MPRKNKESKTRFRLKSQDLKFDSKLLYLILILVALGLIAVADASAPQAINNFNDKFFYFKQQILWAGIGLVGMTIVSKIHYSFWEKVAKPLFFASLIPLLIVLIPGVGSSLLGARRWIILGPMSFQPSELVKLTLAIYLAKVAKSNKSMSSYVIPIAIVAGLIMMQPDLGTTLIVGIETLSQLFIAGVSLISFLGIIGISILGGLVLSLTSAYRRERLLGFFKLSHDPLGSSYHIRQVLFALGSGGLLGVGLGASRQKYLFLPEAAGDSIFSVIAEEVGFVGSAILIAIFVYYLILGFKIIKNSSDKFSQVLSTGIVAWIIGQTFLNIGSMTSLVPLTGVPLPFFSYGGTALVTILVANGILLNISKNAKQHKT
ncbi:putative lipid II flippase FtsW [Candidatus Woesebacteria bacterium]|nr:putative lipid II flippase FtsW [Candidatus Woesebacteria bacterium]